MQRQTKKREIRYVDKSNPLNDLPPDLRRAASELGLANSGNAQRRGKRGMALAKDLRRPLPVNWRQIVFRIVGTRPSTLAELAAGLGISVRTLNHRLADPNDELRDAVEVAKANLFRLLADPIFESMLADTSEESFTERRWWLQRLFPHLNPNSAAAVQPQQTNVQVNIGAELPRAMTPQQYARLFEPVKSDAKSDEVPSASARNA